MKGSIFDIIFVLFMGMMAVFAILLIFIFLSNFNTTFQTLDVVSQSKTAIASGVTGFLMWDQALVFLIGGLMVASLIGAALLKTHPLFFVLTLMGLILALVIGSQVANIFLEIMGAAQIAPYSNQFPLILTFYQNMPVFMLIYGAILLVVMFAFGSRNEQPF